MNSNIFVSLENSNLKVYIFNFRFDNVRVPRENLLNSVADVSADGKYLSSINDPDQVLSYLLLMLCTVPQQDPV